MDALVIRRAEPADAADIAAFNAAMAAETEALTLDPATVRRGVDGVFADPTRGTYWVAERVGRVVGCLLLTWEWSDWRARTFWWIQSVYVRPEDRATGVFTRLFEAIVREARAGGDACGIRLYVERDNARAKRTYTRLGMRGDHYEMLELDL